MQALALVALNHLDLIEREEQDVKALKRSLISNGGFDHKTLFPDYFPAEEKAPEQAFEGAEELDLRDVEWLSPSEAYDQYEQMMAALKGAASGTISGDRMTEEPTWTEWE